ncbi:uncharacterized protein PV09_03398 [Verruconis gallopava]|uniref:Transcription factor IIIC putative zinc-finger domain-containing protein n=1 Tax=Verruconis gallopava TaxID=253628 RepID=A0A0D1XS48_9PEZI|nr:uncharacterized protein PV09_03398 [Verruconis gallopava]KIW05516.1 hypothetical protein PV09_03398 [Verruconis gallopava]
MPWLQTQTYEGFTEKMSEIDTGRSADLTINVWPTATNCIDWSQDADIVVAAGDDVQLLIPKLKTMDDAPTAMWELIRLRVNAFSDAELEQQDPISSRSASIGEEISTAEAVAVKWTPPGIAKHGRCGLFVHTQNLLLSIWAPENRPKSPQDWKRRTIVNRELQRHYERIYPKEKQKPGQPRSERLKELIRVRAFGLSKHDGTNKHPALAHHLENVCYIATSNDNNDVVILRCFRGDEEDGGIQLKAEAHFSITGENPTQSNLTWTFEDYMVKSRFVQHLSWSPWIRTRDGGLKSLLACGTRSKLCFKCVHLLFLNGEPKIEIEDFEGSVNLETPWTSDVILDWLSESNEEEYGKLLAYTADEVMLFTIDMLGDAIIRHAKYERKEWGQVAGALFLLDSNRGKTFAQFLRHMSISDNILTCLELDDLSPTDVHNSGLIDAVKHNRKIYDSKFGTHGDVLVRIWGLAGSPLHDLAVLSATFHPSNSPEYIIPADMSSRVIFQSTGRDDFMTQAIQQSASSEAIAFSAKWITKDLKTQPEKNKATWALLDQIDKAMAAITIHEPDPATSSFKDLLYTSNSLTRLRYERILSLVTGHNDAAAEMEKQVLEHLAIKVLQVPPSRYTDSKHSRLVLSNLRRILVKLNLSTDKAHDEACEKCDICMSSINFDEYAFAQCNKGHKFRRCALTFLAIQAPRISKSCGICGKQYLRSSHVENQNPAAVRGDDVDMIDASADASAPTIPLTELLLTACIRCIYCGGKFVG